VDGLVLTRGKEWFILRETLGDGGLDDWFNRRRTQASRLETAGGNRRPAALVLRDGFPRQDDGLVARRRTILVVAANRCIRNRTSEARLGGCAVRAFWTIAALAAVFALSTTAPATATAAKASTIALLVVALSSFDALSTVHRFACGTR
jgi:hypothetical protein